MKVNLSDVTQTMQKILTAKGYSPEDRDFIITMYLGGELRGHTSHGLSSFPAFARADFSQCKEPEVLQETAACFMIDAKSNPGVLVGRRAADEAIARARSEITGTAIVKDMASWLRPGAIAEYIADQGYVAIVINNGGGAAIAPPGGYDPVAGTNPIAYGIPTNEGSLVVDLATSKRAWGQVRMANKYGTELPEDSFYDNEGNITRDPKKAWSVMPFGDYKGFSLALLIEVMCGSLLGVPMRMTGAAGSSFDAPMLNRGGMIFVIDPAQTVGLEQFKQDNSAFVKAVKETHPHKNQAIRIPGEKAIAEQKRKQEENVIDIPDGLWDDIKKL